MKTKIIYISGNEVFDMADIRAVFEQVRATLNLAQDTVLFGVPVDCDDALADVNMDKNVTVVKTESEPVVENVVTPEPMPAPEMIVTPMVEPVVVPDVQDIIEPEPVVEKPKKTSRRGRPRATVTETVAETPDNADNTVATDDIEPAAETAPEADEAEDKVIPILSILGGKAATSESDTAKSTESESEPGASDEITDNSPVETIVADIDLEKELVITEEIDDQPQNIEPVTITDMIDDAAPVAPVEHTLEKLLDSMAPLSEDHIEDKTDTVEQTIVDDEFIPTVQFDNLGDDDTDATLAQLASEFVETEDKIDTPTKNQNHGKIGKLKNILPFKKTRRDDTGLMGDLFGWAGIAANDDEFSMPGFFTGARVKK